MFGIHKSRGTWPHQAWWLRETLIVLTVLALGLFFVTQANAADGVMSRKMGRQIDVMERIIDQVLIDSPNFLVHGRDNARGLYLEEYGVLFTFDATLVHGSGDDLTKMFKKWELGFHVEEGEDGSMTLVIPDFSGDEDLEDVLEDEGLADDVDELRSWRDREQVREERLYKRGKAEIVDLLLDYGDTLTSLPDGSWVAVVAFLRDNRFFEEEDFSKLVLKAKIDDLRMYTSEDISEEEMIKRIVEQEY